MSDTKPRRVHVIARRLIPPGISILIAWGGALPLAGAMPTCPNPLPKPGGEYFSKQWHHENPGTTPNAPQATVDADVDTPLAWECTSGVPQVIIALIEDLGTELSHHDLAANRFCNTAEDSNCDGVEDSPGDDSGDANSLAGDIGGWDFVGNDNDLGPPNLHGTAMAGVAVARQSQAQGVWGACPRCRFLPIRAEPVPANKPVDYAQAVKAIRYALEMKAQIITVPPWLELDSSDPNLQMALAEVSAAGALLVIGAGNLMSDTCQPSKLQSLGSGVLAVSSSTSRDAKAMGIPDSELDQYIGSHPDAPIPGQTKNIGQLLTAGKTIPEIRALIRANQPHSKNGAAIGNCVDLLAPSWHYDGCLLNGMGSQATCTSGIATADRLGQPGYNLNPATCGPDELNGTDLQNVNYTRCFGGVSSARALTAGVAGLALSVRPELGWSSLQRLLQDTADKIEPSLAGYDPKTGFSSPQNLPATHAWGRLNAFEAVRLLAPTSQAWSAGESKWQGGNGVDIFLRDHDLDWGNTEQPSDTRFEPTSDAQRPKVPVTAWQSPDIKVDVPEYQSEVSQTSAGFDAFADEAGLEAATMTRIHVRARNRGPVAATDVSVMLYWAWKEDVPGSEPIPSLASGFWTSFKSVGPHGTGGWHSVSHGAPNLVTIESLPYSGASIAGCPGRPRPDCEPSAVVDQAQVVTFPFKTPEMEPGQTRELYLLAILDSTQDPVGMATRADLSPAHFVPRDNNVALRRITVKSAP